MEYEELLEEIDFRTERLHKLIDERTRGLRQMIEAQDELLTSLLITTSLSREDAERRLRRFYELRSKAIDSWYGQLQGDEGGA